MTWQKEETVQEIMETKEILAEIIARDSLTPREKLQVEGAIVCLTQALNGRRSQPQKRFGTHAGDWETGMLIALTLLGGILIGLAIKIL